MHIRVIHVCRTKVFFENKKDILWKHSFGFTKTQPIRCNARVCRLYLKLHEKLQTNTCNLPKPFHCFNTLNRTMLFFIYINSVYNSSMLLKFFYLADDTSSYLSHSILFASKSRTQKSFAINLSKTSFPKYRQNLIYYTLH